MLWIIKQRSLYYFITLIYVHHFTTVRLVDGSSSNEGRVEVYYNGEWGTVCDNEWNERKVHIVCMQLGLGSTGISESFAAGSGNILLSNILCSENDTILASCGHYGVGIIIGCNHNDDVGVKCFGMTGIIQIFVEFHF